ncbi:MAG TPA: UDP-N-acetylenolpyruvoylglucosamine reductase, partial [Candidatus Krumholzibacteria bacterium]|nr:UDP-N-acetylenolpyruvoylglucosamine reductase [Candidatus Krumholzibacteria bacterium]
DENHRSAGSFFTNPVVDDDTLGTVLERAGRLDPEATPPRWEIGPGHTKIAAAWLIERSGFGKGHGTGEAGLSTRHVLALVNRGRANTQDLIDLAREVRDGVLDTFGVRLRPEPVPLGFEPGEVDDLWR